MSGRSSATIRLTQLALLTTVALIIFVIEANIPPLTSVPGVKMGLANIVTLSVFYLYGRKDALRCFSPASCSVLLQADRS